MRLDRKIPLPAIAFRQFDAEGGLDCVVAARGTFRHVQHGTAAYVDDQPGLILEDIYEGDPHQTPLLHQTDLTPDKPATDVTFLGLCYAPGGQAMPDWPCRLQIGTVDKTLHVFGPRTWQPVLDRRNHLTGWDLSAPEAAHAVGMDWRLTAGGPLAGDDTGGDEDDPPDLDPYNPIGIGAPPTTANTSTPCLAPNIQASPEPLDWQQPGRAAGFGPLPPFWRDRQQHAGTYDEEWQDSRHPLLPRDFDRRFWQAAPPDQIVDPYLAPGASYALTHLHSTHAVAAGTLPDVTLGVLCSQGGQEAWHVLNLDGVQFDWRDEALIRLTWRARFPLPEAADAVLTLQRIHLAEPDTAGAAA